VGSLPTTLGDAGWSLVDRLTRRRFATIGTSLMRVSLGAVAAVYYLVHWADRAYLFGPDAMWPYATFLGDVADRGAFSIYAWSSSEVWFEIIFHLGWP